MRLSLRVWQTALFFCVILVIMSILYYGLFSTLQTGVSSMAESQLRRESSELAHHMATDLQLNDTPEKIRDHLIDFIQIYEDDIWVYDKNGKLIFFANDRTTPGNHLDKAMTAGLSGKEYVWYSPSENRGVVGKPIEINGKNAGAIVVSTVAANAENVLFTARRELSYAFWIALAVSSLLGLAFSETIAYQVRALTRGAHEIARGKFDHRLTGLFLPHEMRDLTNSFNLMAEKLKHAFEALKTQQREMSAVIANMTEGVIEIDERGMLRLANHAAAKLLGFETEDLMGRKLDEIANDGILEVVVKSLAGKAASGISSHNDRVILVHAAPMRDEQLNTIASVVLMSDVTEQKRLEQAQKDFISNASHELRTPISSLKGFVELLESGAKDKKDVRDSFLRTMQSEIDRLQRLVEELFVLAQYDSGGAQLKLEECDVDKLIEDVYAVASPIADSSGINIHRMVETGLPKTSCDRDKIVQVLLSFVDNAIKHSEPGTTISLTARSVGKNGVEVGVTDEGVGISPDDLHKIFDPQ
ncbi:MAG: cell wall metabolism sensor histidine kinase WalK [Actinobacteria bacterium]|nr:cell wall metabolism sensor histidine kinase WalK [Actinomycetota bacterium]